ncbi:hypothetical protein C8034_v001182 [Colletotrichum sidae]|uniref:rRNA-processing protein efg1 n=1 Tax=Colletotrichum sidae TaxID=1347389 RepID=A0A4V3I2U3_9PEZI|nr:hypothetical protein C8034_v001182 [Colletotrichum sidae]
MPAASSPQRVNWAALKAFIADKESFEARTGCPAPLTEQETAAIAILLRPPPRPDPELGSQNWIGLLNRFLQVRAEKVRFEDEARQEPRLGKAPDLRWACFATFDSTGDKFPRPGDGTDLDAPQSPDFARKQDAKQYAAKCACKWLMDNGQMLPSGDLPKYPLAFGPSLKKTPPVPPTAASTSPAVVTSVSPTVAVLSPVKALPVSKTVVAKVPAKRSPPTTPPTEPSNNARKQEGTTIIPSNSTSLPAPKQPLESPRQKPPKAPRITSPLKPSTPTSSSSSTPRSGSESEVSVTKRVQELCSHLHLPVPRYVLREDTSVPGADLWNGRPDFDDNPHVPDDLGVVTRVFTKKAAKEKMAEEMLDWLNGLLEERRKHREDFNKRSEGLGK